MIPVDRLNNLLRASGAAVPRRRIRTHPVHPVRCDQCPATWLIGDTKREAETRLANHRHERHP
jgi:hypothetical protein